ncbi:MAG: hypothetical protein IGS48_05565 [Oscillatoriales cyanobacterium C42_A2020_001]|nr:hypothetical protein [Leptolyngbyaceae cyanobacterium C42_A2020_001]
MKLRLTYSTSQWLKSGITLFSLLGLFIPGVTALAESSPQVQATLGSAMLLGQQPATRKTIPNRLPGQVRNAVLQTHARQLRVPINQLRVVSFSQEAWSDTCLGLGRPEEGCGLMMVSGWRVEVGHGPARWFYRTDATGRSLRVEEVDNVGSLPQVVERRVLAFASRELRIPVNQLKIVTGRSQLWNGCLGVAGPNQPCTMIGIPGWQVVVAGQQQYWVYHLNQQGTLIKRNPTTSGRGTLLPSYWQPDASMIETNSGDIIFQSMTSGGIAGEAYKTVLRRDGQVLRIDLRSQPPKIPTLIRKLTPQQVQTFIQTLQQNEFEDFLGFNYIPTVGADYFTIALIAPGSKQGTQYGDIAQDQTPPKLQQIAQAWNRIAMPDQQ